MMERNRPIRRKAGTRVENRRLLIVCEGEKTEVLYFEGFRQRFRLATATVKVVGTGADPMSVVCEAEQSASAYDETWCVFDVEAPSPHARLEAALAHAARANLKCALSNPCFELWLVLHFRAHTAYVDNAAIQRLLGRCGCGYDPDNKGFDFAKLWERHRLAIERAKALDIRQKVDHPRERDRNPWTSVHEVVEELIKIGERQM